MRFASAVLALIFFDTAWAEGPVGPPAAPPGTLQLSLSDKPAAPLPRSTGQHTFIQGDADYETCVNNVTGATAVALTCFAATATHIPSGGVAGLFIGAGIGHFVLGPAVCSPDPKR